MKRNYKNCHKILQNMIDLIHTHTCVYMNMCICVYVYAYMYICMYVCTYVRMYVSINRDRASLCSSGSPGTLEVNQAGVKLRDLLISA